MDSASPQVQPPSEHRIEREVLTCDPFKPTLTQAIVESEYLKEVSAEIHQGLELLKKYRLSATFYGSARHGMKEFYKDAQALAYKLSESGFTIVTGGADGVMGAANKGAHKAGGPSVGLNIKLPSEQRENQFVTESMRFDFFFTRKLMLSLASEAYFFFPGGFGTLDELFDVLTLIQTGKMPKIPVVLFGKLYWQPLTEFIEKRLCEEYQAIDKEDLNLYYVADTVDEAYEYALKHVAC